ncbi:MAG: hypothetical protein J6S67_20265 [Methanobrevibacter sp.]|nr:hypothetical protein [Methanobrevibacter sp.]
MDIDWETHVLVGDTILAEFKEYINSTVKKIKEQSKEPECAIKEHVLGEVAGELHKMIDEIYYEQADFLATIGNQGDDE